MEKRVPFVRDQDYTDHYMSGCCLDISYVRTGKSAEDYNSYYNHLQAVYDTSKCMTCRDRLYQVLGGDCSGSKYRKRGK